MKRLILLLVMGVLVQWCFGQDFSNKGKDFWVGYGSHVAMYAGNGTVVASGGTQNMKLYFTSDLTANVTITIPATGWTRTYLVPANTVVESDDIPKSGADDARLTSEGLNTKGIHVTSDRNIVAYAHIFDGSVSGATLLFPTNTLGREYYSLNFDQHSNSANSYCFFYAVATDTGITTIEITPSANTSKGLTAGTTYTYNLRQGEIINILGNIIGNNGEDLTGSVIKSVSTGTNGCKPIAVFSGSGKINISCPASASGGSADNYMVQSFPKNAWGKNYLTVPTKDMPNNYFRIMVSDPAAVVKLNGNVLSGIINGRYYQVTSSVPNLIESDQPIMVAQYITTRNVCGNNATINITDGDPEMIYLSAIEQTINNITFNSTNHAAITRQYFNAVVKTGAVSSFKLDDVSQAASFIPHPSFPGYSYAQLSGLSAGNHTATSDSGFNAIVYGYGNAESYGYNAGTNVKDLYQHILIKNEYGTIDFPATCVNTPFTFSITLPYQATLLQWDFHGVFPNVSFTQPVADSSYVVDSKTVYVYRIPTPYNYGTIGSYPVTVTALNPTPDGCSGLNQIDYEVEVYGTPKADWSFLHSGCISDSIRFIDSSKGFGRPVVRWQWNFGDNTIDSVKKPTKAYQGGGSFPVKLFIITDVGCVNDTTKIFNISSLPLAAFTIDQQHCQGLPITFTDNSTVQGGTLVKRYWDYGDGGKDTLLTGAANRYVYKTPGTYTIRLIVETSTGCKSVAASASITIDASPQADFSFAKTCLPDSGRFTNLSTISDGTAAQFGYAWTFGDGGTAAVQNPAHLYTTAGPFSARLTVTSSKGCTDDTTKTLTNIFAKPLADFTLPAEICLKDSSRFADASTAVNQTVTKWLWVFGNGKTDSIQKPATLFATAGTYNVKLLVTSNQGCSSDTVTKPHLVNVLPAAIFTAPSPVCAGVAATFTNQSLANGGNITKWYWTLGDGRTVDTANGNAFPHLYKGAGPYTVRLAVTTNKGCKSDTTTGIVNIVTPPTAAFILPDVCLSDASAQFTDSSYAGANAQFTYAWNFGDALSTTANPNTSTLQNPGHKYSATGNYNVTLTIGSANGCSATLVKQLVVNGDIPKADFTVLGTGNYCSNIVVQIQNLSSVNFGSITKTEIFWDWVNNPAAKDTDTRPSLNKVYSHLYPNFQTPASKTMQIRMLAYSGGICVDDEMKIIEVNASPRVQFLPAQGVCLDAAPRLLTEASETGGVTGTATFTGTGVTTAGLFNPAVSGKGTFNISYLFVTDKGCRDSATGSQTVYAYPLVNAGPDKFVLPNGIAQFNATATNASGYIYEWTPAMWIINPNVLKAAARPQGDITYTLKVTGDGGCSGTDSVFVKYVPDFKIPNAFSPNGDGINDNWDLQYLESYPGTTIQLYDRYGKIVFSSTNYIRSFDGKVNGADLPVGVYYYVIDPKNGLRPITGSVTLIR